MHGFFNTAGPTEDFRERKESVKKPCRADANTCPFVHVFLSLFLTILVQQDEL